MESKSPVDFDELKLNEVISKGPLDFHEWTSLISEIDKKYPDDIKKTCLVYDSFLSKFPLCYGYWRKYADHKTRLCTVDKVVEIFERAVQSATYSVGVWVDCCTFSMSVFEDSSDIRRLFQRDISFVGKDYMCHTLWDKYIELELSQQQWSSLTHIYTKALRFPTKKLRHYYNCFKKLVAFWEEEIKCQSISATEKLQKEPVLESKEPICFWDDEISCIIKDLLDPSAGFARSKALQKYLSLDLLFKVIIQKESTLLHYMVYNYRALLEEIIDVALPPILLGILVLGVHSVVKSYSRGWKCWIAILTLCRMYEMVLQRQSAFHPRNYIVLIRKVSTNLPEVVDMVMPTVLLVIIMIASHFLYFAPIPWPLIHWAAALVLCIIFIVRAHIQNRWPKQEDGDAGGQTPLAMII